MFALAAQETSRGWSGPIALGVAVAVFIAFATMLDAWQRRRGPSPTPADAQSGVRVKPQVSSVSDTDDTDDDPSAWWGRIVDIDGRRTRQAQPATVRDEVDLALDDDEETLEAFVARMDAAGVSYAEIVREAMRVYGVSESTSKRRIREVRAAA